MAVLHVETLVGGVICQRGANRTLDRRKKTSRLYTIWAKKKLANDLEGPCVPVNVSRQEKQPPVYKLKKKRSNSRSKRGRNA